LAAFFGACYRDPLNASHSKRRILNAIANAAPSNAPHPEVCRPKAGASKDTPQHCSLHPSGPRDASTQLHEEAPPQAGHGQKALKIQAIRPITEQKARFAISLSPKEEKVP